MKTTKTIINQLADEYLNNMNNYSWGIMTSEWKNRIANELNLKNLSDLELSNMWDMVHLTLRNEFYYHDRNKNYDIADKYLDIENLFLEVIFNEMKAIKHKH